MSHHAKSSHSPTNEIVGAADSNATTSTAPLLDARPISVKPNDRLVNAAMRDVPQTMLDMENAKSFGAPDPSDEQRIVNYADLIKHLMVRYKHSKEAAEWAIHGLVHLKLLACRCGWMWRSLTPLAYLPNKTGEWVKDIDIASIESTGRLWDPLRDAWQSLVAEKAGPAVAVDATLADADSPKEVVGDKSLPARWYHEQGEPPPTHAHGPVSGNKKQLCKWVGINNRTFTEKCRRGHYWVRKVTKIRYELWFRNESEFSKASLQSTPD